MQTQRRRRASAPRQRQRQVRHILHRSWWLRGCSPGCVVPAAVPMGPNPHNLAGAVASAAHVNRARPCRPERRHAGDEDIEWEEAEAVATGDAAADGAEGVQGDDDLEWEDA